MNPTDLANQASLMAERALIVAQQARDLAAAQIFGFLAAMLAAVNIFGGFIVTRRMLAMFKRKG